MKSQCKSTKYKVSCENPIPILQTSNNKINLRLERSSLSPLILDHLVTRVQKKKYASFPLCELYEHSVLFHPKCVRQSANYVSLLSKFHAPKH